MPLIWVQFVWVGWLAVSMKGKWLSHVTRKSKEYCWLQMQASPSSPSSSHPSPWALPSHSLLFLLLPSLSSTWLFSASLSAVGGEVAPEALSSMVCRIQNPSKRDFPQQCWQKALQGGVIGVALVMWPSLKPSLHPGEGNLHLTGPRACARSSAMA